MAFAWRDRRNGGIGLNAPSEIFCAIKPNGSSVVGPNFLLNDSLVNYNPLLDDPGNDFMSMQFRNDTIHAVWGDARNGNINIFYNRYAVSNNTNFITSINKEVIDFYPNPSQDYIYTKSEKISEVFIYNSAGELQIHTKDNVQKVDISRLENGNYIIQFLLQNKETIAAQFVKQ